ncbi:MAG: hypothetical protein RDA78_08645 [Roseibium sp.]|uniref:hypothetical protein n=1 Tax=Roseibium sp. TaxID=1936156 RepID=UPI003D9C1EEB
MAALEDPPWNLLDIAADNILGGLAFAADFLGSTSRSLSHYLENESHMTKAFWSPPDRPDNWREFLDDFAGLIDSSLATIKAKLSGFRIDLIAKIEKFLGFSLPEFFTEPIKKVQNKWNAGIDFLIGRVNAIGSLKPTVKETTDAVLGFLSGLWDGIADALAGIFDMVALVASLMAAWLRANKNLSAATQVVLETVDEIVGALTRIEWLKLWDWLERNAETLWDAATERATQFFDRVVTNTALAGYYFGYLVYIIIEFMLPPLKFSTIIQNTRRLQSAAFFRKVFA